MSGSLYSTSNLYFSILQNVYHDLIEHCESDDYSLSNMATKMKVKFDKYWGEIYLII
jgi:rRNA maturation endonuclease Nob1